jgi:hypothetical protein
VWERRVGTEPSPRNHPRRKRSDFHPKLGGDGPELFSRAVPGARPSLKLAIYGLSRPEADAHLGGWFDFGAAPDRRKE